MKWKVNKLVHNNFKLICSENELGQSEVVFMLTAELSDTIKRVDFQNKRIKSINIWLETKE